MGQKVNPIGLRIGIVRTWNSKWFADKDYAKQLHEDLRIRKFIKEKLFDAGISRVLVERAAGKIKLNVHTARPGIVIGKKGQRADEVKLQLQKMTSSEVFLNIHEVRKAEVDAQLVAENVAAQLERRASFRRVMKKAVGTALRMGAQGVKIRCAGRLGGAEMARREWYREGQVPLHTLRADIDYGTALARTTYGVIGVKCWIYKGEVI
ncbi:MAG: 30S ribosomal protein S3 [Deltaproteobacteria bacterium]|nr:30S ribosomal protein S3 [Deltaproteobacteria bacterium]